MPGHHMFVRLLQAYREQPAAITLQYCARVLPHLRATLTHKNAEHVNVALATLSALLDDFTEPIKHALAANASFGVDLAYVLFWL